MQQAENQSMLPFEGGGASPVQYFVSFDSIKYYIRYRWGVLEVYNDDSDFLEKDRLFSAKIGGANDGDWNARETNVYLSLLSHSIQSGIFDPGKYPNKTEVSHHQYFQLGPYPKYPVGLICGVNETLPVPSYPTNRHIRKRRRLQGVHDHNINCLAFVSARDVVEWIFSHPVEHQTFRLVYSKQWHRVAQDLELNF